MSLWLPRAMVSHGVTMGTYEQAMHIRRLQYNLGHRGSSRATQAHFRACPLSWRKTGQHRAARRNHSCSSRQHSSGPHWKSQIHSKCSIGARAVGTAGTRLQAIVVLQCSMCSSSSNSRGVQCLDTAVEAETKMAGSLAFLCTRMTWSVIRIGE